MQSKPSIQSTANEIENHQPLILPAQMCLLPADEIKRYGDYPEKFLPVLLTRLSAVNDHNITVNKLNGAIQ